MYIYFMCEFIHFSTKYFSSSATYACLPAGWRAVVANKPNPKQQKRINATLNALVSYIYQCTRVVYMYSILKNKIQMTPFFSSYNFFMHGLYGFNNRSLYSVFYMLLKRQQSLAKFKCNTNINHSFLFKSICHFLFYIHWMNCVLFYNIAWKMVTIGLDNT